MGDSPDASMLKCKPLLSVVIRLLNPKTSKSLPIPTFVKSNHVEADEKPGSAGHDFLVGSQAVDVCAATKGSIATRTDAENNMTTSRALN